MYKQDESQREKWGVLKIFGNLDNIYNVIGRRRLIFVWHMVTYVEKSKINST